MSTRAAGAAECSPRTEARVIVIAAALLMVLAHPAAAQVQIDH
jgi:hypothetical protein